MNGGSGSASAGYQEVTLRRSARGSEGRGPVREIQVEQDGGDHWGVCEEREDGHLAAATTLRAVPGQSSGKTS